jgi:PAS domain S-box-containing protein
MSVCTPEPRTRPAFLDGGGEAGAALRARDWSSVALGSPEHWSESLKLALRLMLTANHPAAIFWGPERICFYNDAYSRSLGPEKHPKMLGAPGRVMWAEGWDVIGPPIERAINAGGATSRKNELIPIFRHGALHEVYWTYSCSPIHDSSAPSSVGGAFLLCQETTETVQSERQRAFLLELGEALQDLTDPQCVAETAAARLGAFLGVNRVVFSEFEEDGPHINVWCEWNDGAVPRVIGRHRPDEYGRARAEAFRRGENWIVDDVLCDDREEVRNSAKAYLEIGVRSGVGVPLKSETWTGGALGVHSTRPRRWSKSDVAFIEVVAARAWASIRRTRAESALAERETQLRVVADAMPALISYFDRGLRYRFINAAYCDWFGLPKDQILGRSLMEVLGETAWESIRPHVETVLSGRQAKFEGLLSYARGGPRHVSVQYIPDKSPSGRTIGAFVLVNDISDRKKAEIALAESEARFREVADSTPAPVWMTDENGALVFCNRSMIEIFGGSFEDIAGDGWIASMHPDDRARVAAARAAAWADGHREYVFEARFRRGDGEWRWFEARSRPRFGRDKEFRGYIGLAFDRTEARDAAAALADSEARFREIANSTPTPVWLTDRDGRMVFVNAQFVENTGLTADEAQGDGWKSLIHPEDVERVASARKAAWEAGCIAFSYLARFRRRDGVWRWMEVTSRPRRADNGEFRGYIGMAVDFTDVYYAQQTLAESEARFRSLANDSPVMVWVSEADGACTFLSRSWSEFTGQTEQEGLGFGWLAAIHPEHRAEAERQYVDANARKAPFRMEYRLRRRDGEFRWVLDAARPRFSADGAFLGYVGSVIDIDERKRADEQRRLLIDELNHRVKNNLAVVQSLARQTFGDDPDTEGPRRIFEGRLAALAEAHNLLTERSWRNAEIGAIAHAVLSLSGLRRSRVRISGPKIVIPPKKAVTLALALHELRANAGQHGALSNEAGTVSLEWKQSEKDGFVMTWRETGGPPVEPPTRRGFGLRMIEQMLASDLRGAASVEFHRQGVVCTIKGQAFL